jgi:hypothetical protein
MIFTSLKLRSVVLAAIFTASVSYTANAIPAGPSPIKSIGREKLVSMLIPAGPSPIKSIGREGAV